LNIAIMGALIKNNRMCGCQGSMGPSWRLVYPIEKDPIFMSCNMLWIAGEWIIIIIDHICP